MFYNSCLEDRDEGGSGDISRADSAVCLTTPRDPFPAVLQVIEDERKLFINCFFLEVQLIS